MRSSPLPFHAARARVALLVHRGVEAGLVEREAAPAQDVLGEVDREAERVVELEDDLAGQRALAPRLRARAISSSSSAEARS